MSSFRPINLRLRGAGEEVGGAGAEEALRQFGAGGLGVGGVGVELVADPLAAVGQADEGADPQALAVDLGVDADRGRAVGVEAGEAGALGAQLGER